MFTRFHAIPRTRQHDLYKNSDKKRGFGISLIRPTLLLAASACLLSFAIDESAAQAFPCSEPDSCDYRLPPVTDPRELIEQSDLFAIEVLGYSDEDGNSIPDYRERYVRETSDCTTISAQLDYILEQMGVMGVLNSEQASGAGQIRDRSVTHAYNYVPGIGDIDITPFVSRDFIYPNIGAPQKIGSEPLLYLKGYPDPGEFVDPAYGGPSGDQSIHEPQPPLLPSVP